MIEVKRTPDFKTLVFGDNYVQGRLHVSGNLSLLYMQEMVKIFQSVSPKHICILGLGAGNMHTYLLKKYPELHIDTVENNPDVISVAIKEFNLPKTKRLRILEQDAKEFIQERHNYDIVFVDVYDENGQVYLDDRWLRKQGKILVYNSLVTKDTYHSYMAQLRTMYPRVHEQYKPELTANEYNHVAFCYND
tara:strand:+ start:1408 stop:1980 length:573 start_codon:yes stop_codon:yes gene_type:complete